MPINGRLEKQPGETRPHSSSFHKYSGIQMFIACISKARD